MKYAAWSVGAVAALLLLAVAALYTPVVQRMAVRRLARVVGQSLGGELDVGALRLRFPLRLTAEDIRLTVADSVSHVGMLSADVAPWPLSRGRIELLRADVSDVSLSLPDTAAWQLRAGLERLELRGLATDFSLRNITIDSMTVSGLQLLYNQPSVELDIKLFRGGIETLAANLESRAVTASRVALNRCRGGWRAKNAPQQVASDAESLPWSVAVDALTVVNSDVRYADADSRDIAVERLNLHVDSLYNRGAEVALLLCGMNFQERGGVVVADAEGRFGMDGDTLLLRDFHCRTPLSSLHVDAALGDFAADARLEVDCRAEIDAQDPAVGLFVTLPPLLRHRTAELLLQASGRLSNIDVEALRASISDLLTVNISGRAVDVATPSRSIDARFSGRILPQQNIGESERIAVVDTELRGRVSYDRSRIAAEVAAEVGRGVVVAEGEYRPRDNYLRAAIRADEFPLGAFLPYDSLWVLSCRADFATEGFEPDSAVAELDAEIYRVDFRGRDFGGAALRATLRGGELEGLFSDTDSALRTTLHFTALMSDTLRRAEVSGRMEHLDLAALGLAKRPLEGSFSLRANGRMGASTCAAELHLDSIDVITPLYAGRVENVTARLAEDAAGVRAEVVNGLLALRFSSPSALDTLFAGFSSMAKVAQGQLLRHNIDMSAVTSAAPHFRLDITAHRRNLLFDMARRYNISVAALDLSARNCDTAQMVVNIDILRPKFGGVALDTLGIAVAARHDSLTADLHLAAPQSIRAEMRSAFSADSLLVAVNQQDNNGNSRFRFGLAGVWRDSLLRLSLEPHNPLFASRVWQVDADNFVEYRTGGVLTADLDLSHRERRFALHADGRVAQLDIAGAQLGSILSLLPSPPSLQANINASARVRTDADSLSAEGRLAVDSIRYASPQVEAAGALSATLAASGRMSQPQVRGGIAAAGFSLRVPVIATTFTLPRDTIIIADNALKIDNYGISAPDGSRLVMDGSVDLAGLSSPRADISVRAENFTLLNSSRRAKSDVSGHAAIDVDATIRGDILRPSIRGGVTLLGSTEVTYTLPPSKSPLTARNDGVVSFVSFEEVDGRDAEPAKSDNLGGMDILATLDIERNTRLTVNLSSDGKNRASVQGGGVLTYAMNPMGDSNFSGRYTLSGGSVSYSPPLIAQRLFDITPESYVEWTGDIADPVFDITAVESIRTSVTSEGDASRNVTFKVSVSVRNSLKELEVLFDLSAPEDAAMQNQLMSMSADERAAQAMGLLIYNTYTGPGTTARATVENPLNTFITSELNRWASSSLRGVDLTFGVDTVTDDESADSRTDYTYRLSKNLFGNRVRAVVGGRIATDADPKENVRDNFLSDISLEYLVSRSGNIYLRLFRHSDYESILEGEVIETGAGFVIRKRLSRLGDLFRKTDHEK